MNILVSACLLGMHCRYDGTGVMQEELKELSRNYHLIPVCPEIYGGLATPRSPAECVGERIVTKNGEDVTDAYYKGAEEILHLARLYNCRYAILKERSPSCGYGSIYDGTFQGRLVSGNGAAAQLLSDHGIEIYGESRIQELINRLEDVNI